MLIPKKLSDNRKKIYTVIITIFILAALYLIYDTYLSSFFKSWNNQVSLDDKPVDSIIIPNLQFQFTEEFINKFPYNNLKPALAEVQYVDELGRNNPFQEISFTQPSTPTTHP